jgi:hypothetical protein
MSLLDTVIIAILSVWFVLTVLHNTPEKYLPPRRRRFLRFPLASILIPWWKLFAPYPWAHSYHLLYRDRFLTGEIGPWQEARMALPQPGLRAVWNPAQTISTALIGAARLLSFAACRLREHPDLIKLSVPYLTFLAYVSGLPRLPEISARQFLLLRSSPSGYEVMFLSAVHGL